jgi:hypothetical protein
MELQGYCEICKQIKVAKWHWKKMDLIGHNNLPVYGRPVQTHICSNCYKEEK